MTMNISNSITVARHPPLEETESVYKGSWFSAQIPPLGCKSVRFWCEYYDYGWSSDVAITIIEHDEFYESTLKVDDLNLLKSLDLNPSKPVVSASMEDYPPVVVVYPNAGPGFIGALFKFVGLGRDALIRNWDKLMERRDRFMSSPLTSARLVQATAAINADYQSFPINGLPCTFNGLRIAATPAEEIRILGEQ